MKIRKYCLVCIMIILSLLLCACCPLCDRPNHRWVPYEGVWYCDQLQVQLAFDGVSENYIIIDGEKVICNVENDPGSTWLWMKCIDENHPLFSQTKPLFQGEMVLLDDAGGKYILRDENGVEYVFVRMEWN